MAVRVSSIFSVLMLAMTLLACGGDDAAGPADGDGDPSGQAGAGGGGLGDDGDDDDSSNPSGDGASDDDDDGEDGAGDDGPVADRNEPAAPGVAPTFTPKFPGAGTSANDEPLTNGELCDYVPGNGAPTPDEITTCFLGADDPLPAATLEQVLECADGSDSVHIRLTFNPKFVDNTYGANIIGWPTPRGPNGIGGGHRFEQLVGSDHAEILMVDENDEVILQFKLDYISADPTAPSGYASLGPHGGDGDVTVGDPAWILDYTTSLDRNLNERGYGSYTVDSPATDADYTPNDDAPGWDYRVVYEAWIDVEAFGDAGFGRATIELVHASPAKADDDTIEVTPDDCPPDWCTDPNGCKECPADAPDDDCGTGDPPPDEPPDEGCNPDAPDEDCGTGDPPTGDDPIDCDEEPDDPSCNVE